MEVKNAFILYIGCEGWNIPKSIMVSIDGDYRRRLNEIAEEAFEKYKATQQNKDIYLVSYSYHGDVEILTT